MVGGCMSRERVRSCVAGMGFSRYRQLRLTDRRDQTPPCRDGEKHGGFRGESGVMIGFISCEASGIRICYDPELKAHPTPYRRFHPTPS